MKQEARKSYQTPALIVLVRGKPEEAVLLACKTEALGTVQGDIAQHCGILSAGNCAACQSRGGGAS